MLQNFSAKNAVKNLLKYSRNRFLFEKTNVVSIKIIICYYYHINGVYSCIYYIYVHSINLLIHVLFIIVIDDIYCSKDSNIEKYYYNLK